MGGGSNRGHVIPEVFFTVSGSFHDRLFRHEGQDLGVDFFLRLLHHDPGVSLLG